VKYENNSPARMQAVRQDMVSSETWSLPKVCPTCKSAYWNAAKREGHNSQESRSDREVEVLRHLVDGNRNRDIAKKLQIAEETVKVHMKHIMEKLGANDRTQALVIALRRGLIQL
jgi:DNA-binding NarL/FixJ family response regulator